MRPCASTSATRRASALRLRRRKKTRVSRRTPASTRSRSRSGSGTFPTLRARCARCAAPRNSTRRSRSSSRARRPRARGRAVEREEPRLFRLTPTGRVARGLGARAVHPRRQRVVDAQGHARLQRRLQARGGDARARGAARRRRCRGFALLGWRREGAPRAARELRRHQARRRVVRERLDALHVRDRLGIAHPARVASDLLRCGVTAGEGMQL
mmetsp:Transcript_3801/g.15024  ORF Transcript_3801/g.15024 Transcript_3801/m.15024 type:complete len:213 (-) Transcript_3801:716-1354(-)